MTTRDAAGPGPRRATSRRREREILNAAARMFHRQGYSETSVKDVARAVGILKGSLYYYIDSKEDLLFRVLLDVHEDAKGIVAETAALDAPPLERLRYYVQRHVEFNVRNLPKIAVYCHDAALLSPKRRDAILRQRLVYEDFVKSLVREAQERGDVDASVDPSLAANAVFGLVNWIYTWYDPRGRVPAEGVAKLYAELAVKALCGAEPTP
jgi:AcrR family transcriptional regulator